MRQYVIKFKKSGTKTPRVELKEMGPRMGLAIRRHRTPPPDVEKEACKVAHVGKKKVRDILGFFQRFSGGRLCLVHAACAIPVQYPVQCSGDMLMLVCVHVCWVSAWDHLHRFRSHTSRHMACQYGTSQNGTWHMAHGAVMIELKHF